MQQARFSFALCLPALALLAACRGTSVDLGSQTAVPQAFEHASPARGSAEIGRWWQHWQDPVLSGLVERGLRANHDIRIALGRLNEARATARLADAERGPGAGLNIDASRLEGRIDNPLGNEARSAAANIPAAAGLAHRRFDISGNSLAGGVSASWEPDIFGQKRSDAEAAAYAALGAQEQMYGTRMLVAGDIADNYFKARATQARIRITGRNAATLGRLVRYAEGRFRAGQATAYEVEEVRGKLSALRAQQSTLEAVYAAYVRNIAVLTGQTPQGFALPEGKAGVLAAPPAAPGGQTPQGLLERRPDIRAQAAQVYASAAKLASAKADLLPRFSISFLGGGAIDVSSSDGLQGWAGLLRAGIQVPLFTNGRIKANIGAADARLQTALLRYDQSILKALGEVDSAYQSQHALARQNALFETALKQAQKRAAGAQKLFEHGNKTLDSALSARLDEQQAEENLIQSQLARAQMLVSLYKALGGGWTE